jgi:hypothetical protein
MVIGAGSFAQRWTKSVFPSLATLTTEAVTMKQCQWWTKKMEKTRHIPKPAAMTPATRAFKIVLESILMSLVGWDWLVLVMYVDAVKLLCKVSEIFSTKRWDDVSGSSSQQRAASEQATHISKARQPVMISVDGRLVKEVAEEGKGVTHWWNLKLCGECVMKERKKMVMAEGFL